jgi:hypothetical protein
VQGQLDTGELREGTKKIRVILEEAFKGRETGFFFPVYFVFY